MKNIIALSMTFVSLCIISCTKDDKEASTDGTTSAPVYENGLTFNSQGKLILSFEHTFDKQPLEMSPKTYITQANDTVKVTQLTYYISNVTLTTANGNKVNLGNHNLIECKAGLPSTIELNNVPAGRYISLSYLIGIDSLTNSTGAHTGDLDPSLGMYWTWKTGYVFIRIKGRFSANNSPFSFDIGGDGNTMEVSHNLSSYKAGGTVVTAAIKADISKMFNAPYVYSLKTDESDIHDSGQPSIPKLKTNISNAFSIKNLQ